MFPSIEISDGHALLAIAHHDIHSSRRGEHVEVVIWLSRLANICPIYRIEIETSIRHHWGIGLDCYYTVCDGGFCMWNVFDPGSETDIANSSENVDDLGHYQLSRPVDTQLCIARLGSNIGFHIVRSARRIWTIGLAVQFLSRLFI